MSYTQYSVCLAELMRGLGIATPTHGYKPEQAFEDGRKIAAKITELESQVDGLRKDAARLDALERFNSRNIVHLGVSWYSRKNTGLPHTKHKSLRSAIDAAIKGEQE